MFDFIGVIIGGIFSLAYIALAIAAIVSILGSSKYTSGLKALWVLGVLAFPFLGSLAWFIVGRNSSA